MDDDSLTPPARTPAAATASPQAAAAQAAAAQRRWPAEWEPQAALWLAWPHNQETWPGHYAPIPAAFAALARAASPFVSVRVLADQSLAADATRHLGGTANLEIVDISTNDCWIRDYGPTFVLQQGETIGVDWRFNAWGGKYEPWDRDAAAAEHICRLAGVRREASELVLEGGAIEGDGTGRLLTTPGCVETPTRNPGWQRPQVATELHRRLGVTEIVWLDGGGLAGDDTDGHIDQLARFVDTRHVVVAVTDDTNDPNYLGLQRNAKQLLAWAEQTTPKVTIHRLAIPPPRFIDDARVPESYCNFLMLGPHAVLVPTFRQPRFDQRALGLFRDLLPGREIIAVDAYDFAWGLGAWHCASQQQPR